MVLDIVKYGNPVLRTTGEKVILVDDPLNQLAADMLETMEAANGVGLAAQQVGVPIQLAVVDIRGVEDRPSEMFIAGEKVDAEAHMPLVLLNPTIELGADKETGTEGCLSFPGLSAEVLRSQRISVTAKILDGREIKFEATGLLSRALQHEVDHLNGILFIDRISSAARAGLSGKLKRLQREAQP